MSSSVEQEQDSENPGAVTEPPPCYSRVIYKIRKRASWKWPNLFSDPDRKKHLAIHQTRDARENARTEPPAEELIDLRCIWIVEFYTPSHADRLLASFAALGWDRSEGINRPSPAQWVRQFRENRNATGWYSLGTISREKKGALLGHFKTAPLPSEFDHALGGIFSLTSSITCIVMGFVPTLEQSGHLDRALRQWRNTYLKPSGHGYGIIDPRSQKQQDIEAIRSRISDVAATWFRAHLPGLFSEGILAGHFPTCEFITLRLAEPFPPKGQVGLDKFGYLQCLSLDQNYHAWSSASIPGLKFAWQTSGKDDWRFHSTVTAKASDFEGEVSRMYGEPDRHTPIWVLDSILPTLLSRWGLLAVLSGFERHSNIIRDSATFRHTRGKRALKTLLALGDFVSKSVDITATLRELRTYATTQSTFMHNVEVFTSLDSSLHGNRRGTLGEAIRDTIAERAASLHEVESATRDLLAQYGNVLSASENIKLQRSVGVLTWVLVILTIIITVLTALMACGGPSTGSQPIVSIGPVCKLLGGFL